MPRRKKAKMGGVYRRKDGNYYYAQWTYKKKTYKVNTFKTTEAEAIEECNRLTEPFRSNRGTGVLEALSRKVQDAKGINSALCLTELWPTVAKTFQFSQWGVITKKRNRTRVLAFVEWMSENYPDVHEARHVTKKQAEGFLRYLMEDCKRTGKTVIDYRAALLQAWDLCKEEIQANENVWKNTTRPRRQSEKKRALTEDEVRVLLSVIDGGAMDGTGLDRGELACLFGLGLYTGMRMGDCCLLEWDKVDLDGGTIKVVPSKTKRFNTFVELPIHAALDRILRETPKGCRKGFVMPGIASMYKEKSVELITKTQLVFKKAGIDTTKKNSDGRVVTVVGFHSLRHTFITMALRAGVPLPTVQSVAGHIDASMTAYYCHVSPNDLKIVQASLPDWRSGESSASQKSKVKALEQYVSDWSQSELVEGYRLLHALATATAE